MLKNLEQNISLLFQKLNLNFRLRNLKKLKNSIVLEKDFYTDSVNQNLFLKIKIKKNQRLTKQLETEIEILKIFKKKFKEKERFFPKLIFGGKYKNLFFYLKELEKGEVSGQMDEDFGIKKKILFKISPSHFAKIIHLYQNFKSGISLPIRGGRWFFHDFNRYKKSFLDNFINSELNDNLLSLTEIKEIKKILRENKNFLDQEAKYLSHSDLYPNNFLLTNKGKLIIFDWGWARWNNLAFDVAFVYLLAHRSSNWQNKFLKTFLRNVKEKEKFKKLFNLALISLTIRFAAHCYFHIKDKKEVFLILKKHLKVLKNSVLKLK